MIDEIITGVLKREGWGKYTDDPDDRGGPTKWGITLKAYQDFLPNNVVTKEDIKVMKEVHARVFYQRKYVIDPRFAELPEKLMELVVDCGVHHGPRRASKWLQRSIGVMADGIIGPKTLKRVHALPWIRTYAKICAIRVRFYGEIVRRDHSQAKYIGGWNARAAEFVDRLADLWLDG